MNKVILFLLLVFISFESFAACSYGGGSGANVNVNFSGAKILSDASVPAGTILAVKTVGGNVSNMKTFSNCGENDIYAIVATPGVNEVAGITGIQGGTVYESGIPGIGFQISDAITGSKIRPVPATIGTVSAKGINSSSVDQLTVWLIKTKDTIDTSKGVQNVSISYRAGTVNEVQKNSTIARLLQANIIFGPFNYRATSCEITPRNSATVTLPTIEAKVLRTLAQGDSTNYAKDITLDINCPDSTVGNDFIYWFNPITENSSNKKGVLLNSVPVSAGGAKDVGFIIKSGSTPIEFYDYTSYKIKGIKKTQAINLNVDYYRLSTTISQGEVHAIFEVVIQEQ